MTSMIDQNLAVMIGPSPVENGLPQPPVFSSVEAERKYRKEQLAAGFRIFGRFGFSEGVTGHKTAELQTIVREVMVKRLWLWCCDTKILLGAAVLGPDGLNVRYSVVY